MKVILLKNFKKLGKENDIIQVSDGYANNYLIPNKIAVLYNNQNKKALEQKLNKEYYDQEKLWSQLQEGITKIKDLQLVIKRKCSNEKGHEGKLFGRITSKEIADELKSQNLYELTKDQIILNSPISTIGEFIIDIDLKYRFTNEFLKDKGVHDNNFNKHQIKLIVIGE